MSAYHNDPAIKSALIAQLIAHEDADEIIQGIGWENGHGCAVGCTLHEYDHSQGPAKLGWPEWLLRLEDGLFEEMTPRDAKGFPRRMAEAIPVGADLEPVRLRFLYWTLTDFLGRDWPADVNAALDDMGGLFARAIAGDEPDTAEWAKAERAAWAARDARDALAAGAAGAARAAGAAWAARDARAARAAGGAGAAGAAWAKEQADKLVSLLSEATTPNAGERG